MTINKNKTLSEATVTIDLVDFETSDLNAVSDIFRLAGVAANDTVAPTMSVPPVMGGDEPSGNGFVDLSGFDSIDDEPMGGEAPIGGDLGGDDLGVDEPLGLPSPDEVSPMDGGEPAAPADGDLDVQPDVLLANPDDEPIEPIDDQPEQDDDLVRLGELAGINDIPRDDPMIKENSRLLPNLDLSEDDFNPTDDQTPSEFGPFGTEDECRADAVTQTSGVEGNNFTIIPTETGFYWTRTLGENFSNEPDLVVANTDAIVDGNNYSVEPKRDNRGDNKMVGLSECVEEIYDDISAKFRKYFKK